MADKPTLTIAPWTDHDRIALRKLLEASPLIATLQQARPKVTNENMERAALTGQQREGADKIIEEIISLATVERIIEKSAFTSGDED